MTKRDFENLREFMVGCGAMVKIVGDRFYWSYGDRIQRELIYQENGIPASDLVAQIKEDFWTELEHVTSPRRM